METFLKKFNLLKRCYPQGILASMPKYKFRFQKSPDGQIHMSDATILRTADDTVNTALSSGLFVSDMPTANPSARGARIEVRSMAA